MEKNKEAAPATFGLDNRVMSLELPANIHGFYTTHDLYKVTIMSL
jgi:hypothetical protein